ncbi:MAG TPA: hypothetical protein VE445_00745 [Nitrososphaeraceae archaeon]|nr:hypothetical protein [Nitrososphaeraceae archaeon]
MLTALFIVFGAVLVTALVVVPALEEVDARCDGFKNNGDPCKPKKSPRIEDKKDKDNV